MRSPLPYAGAGDAHARLSRLHEEFSAVLQSPRVYVRHQGSQHFITGHPGDTLNRPADQAGTGEARYRWEDRGDGVQYGYLKTDVG